MHAETIDILVQRAKCEPLVAIAFAEAMDKAMEARDRQSQLVTVPLLDERLAGLRNELRGEAIELKSDLRVEIRDVRVEIQHAKADLVCSMFSALAGQTLLLTGIMYFLLQTVIN